MEELQTYLPVLLPVIVLNVILMITALVHLMHHPRCRVGNRAIWIPIVVLVQMIGPVLYFMIGRGEEE